MASNREQDMMQLQQDAVRRVMEMQRQAHAKVHPEKGTTAKKEEPPPPKPEQDSPKPAQILPKKAAAHSGLLDGILSNTGLEKEQLLLLGLGYLLYKEGADHKLLLAILYLLL